MTFSIYTLKIFQKANQTSPNSAAEAEKKREAEERNERYFKFVTNFSKRQKLPASETTPPAQPIQRALSQIAEAKMNQSSGFSEVFALLKLQMSNILFRVTVKSDECSSAKTVQPSSRYIMGNCSLLTNHH